MSCISRAWCPECRQMVSDSICMCARVCDIHGQVCTTVVPDGRHPVRATRQKTPPTEVEYRNGWEVGYYAWPGGRSWDLPPIWYTREPGHPTKSPQQLQREDFEEKARAARTQWESVFEVRQDGGGI